MADSTIFNNTNQGGQQQPQQDTESQTPNPSTPTPKFESPLYEQPLYEESAPGSTYGGPTQIPTISPASPPPPQTNASKIKLPFHFGTLVYVAIGLGIFLLIAAVIVIATSSHKGSGQHVTLTYWGLWEDKNTMQPIIDDFEKQNPNITINYSEEDIHEYKQRLETRIHNNSSDAPDIFRYHNSWTGSLSKYLAPLSTNVITLSDLQKEFYPVVKNDVVDKNGAIYGIPLEIDTLALFINTDKFSAASLKAPTDFLSEFQSTANHLTTKDQNGNITTSGVAMGDYDYVDHAPDITAMLMAQEKGGVDFRNINNNADKVAEVLGFYTSFAGGDTAVWSDKLGRSREAFATGKAAMMFGYSWDIAQIQAINPNLHFAVVPVPKLPGVVHTTVASYWVEGVSINSPHQKEAMLFMHYLAQKETEQKLYAEEAKSRALGEPYARVDLADTMKSNKYIYPFLQLAQTATSSYFAADTYDSGLNGQVNGQLQDAINSMLTQGVDQTSASQTLVQNVSKIATQFGY